TDPSPSRWLHNAAASSSSLSGRDDPCTHAVYLTGTKNASPTRRLLSSLLGGHSSASLPHSSSMKALMRSLAASASLKSMPSSASGSLKSTAANWRDASTRVAQSSAISSGGSMLAMASTASSKSWLVGSSMAAKRSSMLR